MAVLTRQKVTILFCHQEPAKSQGIDEPAAGVLMITRESATGGVMQNQCCYK